MEKPCLKSLLLLLAMALSVSSYAQKMVLSGPDKNNQKVIKRYNRYHHKTFYSGMSGWPIGYTAVFGVRQNSIMSTDDVEVNVVKKWVQDAAVDDMENRLRRLIGFGLRGIEAFYSGFSEKLRRDAIMLAEKYDLFVTAGSDYHGKNKLVNLGDTGLDEQFSRPEGLLRFLERFRDR